MLDQETLDELWDFGDPAASEQRLRAALPGEHEAELRTQVARALGLQQRFDEAHAILNETDVTAPAAQTRMLLERGRLYNSSGDAAEAVPMFEQAAAVAQANHLDFLEIDALHMLAIADSERAEQWTTAALAVVEATTDQRTKRWAVSLYNNLGWSRFGTDPETALGAFEAAQARASGPQLYIARWTVARCLRELGRADEALAIQEALYVEDPTDEYVVEELALLRAE